MIWTALLIPVLTIIFLIVCFSHRVAWWEPVVLVLVSLCLIGTFKLMAVSWLLYDTEFWTGYVVKARYYEEWTERVTTTTTDSKGRTKTETHYVYHPPYWEAEDNNGLTVSIDRNTYRRFVKEWGNEQFHHEFRFDQSSWGDGNSYSTDWSKKPDTEVVVTTTHGYNNRIQATRNVFDFMPVSKEQVEQFGLYGYPSRWDTFNCPSILGDSNPVAERRLSLLNARLGRFKQIRVWVLVFWDKTVEAARLQEAYWLRGNKNEFVVCIGRSKSNPKEVQWCEAFSWCDRDKVGDLHERVEMDIQSENPFTWDQTLQIIEREVRAKWHRKSFHDFDYIGITVPTWAIWVTFVVTILVNVGMAVWVILNEATADDPDPKLAFEFH